MASAVKHRPADVVPQPLIVKYEVTDSVRELVTLPLALAPAGGRCLAVRHGSTRGLDRVRSRAQVVRCHMGHGTGLACGVRGMPRGATQFSGRTHRVTTGGTSCHHRDLAADPAAGMLDRLTRSPIIWLNRLEQVKDVLRTRRRPQSKQMVV